MSPRAPGRPGGPGRGPRRRVGRSGRPAEPSASEESAGVCVGGPHAVLAALKAGSPSVQRVLVAREREDRRTEEILREARARGVPWSRAPRQALDRLCGGRTHQGIVAELASLAYADRDEVLEAAPRPELLLVLDGVEDPGNLGAILRSAAGAGVGGVFLPRHRAAGLGPGALRASAGTAGKVPVVRERNLADLVVSLERREIACWALASDGETPWNEADLTVPVALIAGGEEKGVRRLVRERCRGGLRLPLASGVESLNVSVAVGAVLFEALRQRLEGEVRPKKEG